MEAGRPKLEKVRTASYLCLFGLIGPGLPPEAVRSML